jgi:hypothetical protein
MRKTHWVPHSQHGSSGEDKLVLLPDIEIAHSLFTKPAIPNPLTGLIFIYWRNQIQRANIQKFITWQTPTYFQYISLKTKHNCRKTLQHAVELYQTHVHTLYDVLVPFYDQPLPTFYCTFSQSLFDIQKRNELPHFKEPDGLTPPLHPTIIYFDAIHVYRISTFINRLIYVVRFFNRCLYIWSYLQPNIRKHFLKIKY